METPDLAALVPSLMARHPHFAWRLLSGATADEVLLAELHPRARPERVATIKVNPHGEVYFLSFGGVESGPDFAYDDEDQVEVFEGLVRDAVAASTGPTRITRRTVDGVEVRTSIVIDPEGPNQRSLGVTYRNLLTDVKARLRGRRRIEEVTDFPSIEDE